MSDDEMSDAEVAWRRQEIEVSRGTYLPDWRDPRRVWVRFGDLLASYDGRRYVDVRVGDERVCFLTAEALRGMAALADPDPATHSSTDCRSEEGITAGLVDALISICRVLAHRDLSPEAVQQALLDLRGDEDLQKLLRPSSPNQ